MSDDIINYIAEIFLIEKLRTKGLEVRFKDVDKQFSLMHFARITYKFDDNTIEKMIYETKRFYKIDYDLHKSIKYLHMLITLEEKQMITNLVKTEGGVEIINSKMFKNNESIWNQRQYKALILDNYMGWYCTANLCGTEQMSSKHWYMLSQLLYMFYFLKISWSINYPTYLKSYNPGDRMESCQITYTCDSLLIATINTINECMINKNCQKVKEYYKTVEQAITGIEIIYKKLKKYKAEWMKEDAYTTMIRQVGNVKSCYLLKDYIGLVGSVKDAGTIDIHMKNMVQRQHKDYNMELINNSGDHQAVGGTYHDTRQKIG